MDVEIEDHDLANVHVALADEPHGQHQIVWSRVLLARLRPPSLSLTNPRPARLSGLQGC